MKFKWEKRYWFDFSSRLLLINFLEIEIESKYLNERRNKFKKHFKYHQNVILCKFYRSIGIWIWWISLKTQRNDFQFLFSSRICWQLCVGRLNDIQWISKKRKKNGKAPLIVLFIHFSSKSNFLVSSFIQFFFCWKV